jgi:hypothetical protein
MTHPTVTAERHAMPLHAATREELIRELKRRYTFAIAAFSTAELAEMLDFSPGVSCGPVCHDGCLRITERGHPDRVDAWSVEAGDRYYIVSRNALRGERQTPRKQWEECK